MTNALIVATYTMAAATFAVFLKILGIAVPTAALIGFVLILFALQIHVGIIRRRERRAVNREISFLKCARREFSVELSETRSRMDEIVSAMEAKATAQSRKIVSELQVLESLMREFASRIADKSKEPASGADEPLGRERARDSARTYLETLGESDLLEIIRASLEENRVDLFLQPIVTLPQRKLRFYEALSRLRAEDGSMIMPSQYMKIAAPVGLMSVVDNLLLFRCVQIVRKLIHKSRDIGIFCNISGDTLADAEFFPQFLEYMHHNRDLAGHIVFEFAQDAVAEAGAKGEENLGYLASLGFALSMDHVDSLAIDFARLKSLGFRHVKVRAETLMEGMGDAGAVVAAEDLKKLLARHGLNLIAERVESEKTVVQLLEFGVDYGQGYLFGEPRAVREDSPAQTTKTELTAPVIPFRRTA